MVEIPSWLQWYKKPAHVDIKKFAASFHHDKSNGSPQSSRPSSIVSVATGGIPKKLALDRILKNKTCSPMSLFDFYMYLKYIELSPENLEFYMWFQDYQVRYKKEMGDFHAAQSEESSFARAVSASVTDLDSLKAPTLKEKPSFTSKTESQVDLVDDEMYNESIFYIESLINPSAPCNPVAPKAPNNPFATYAAKATTFSQELTSIAALFLSPGSQKELNIPSAMRKFALKNIAISPDPSHLEPIAAHVYMLLKSCSHRNFVRLGVSNGTFETVCMATGLGIVLTCAGFLTMLLLAFASPRIHGMSRWHGLGVIPFWIIGISLIMSGLRGSCFFLLLFSRRQPLPWERFEDDASVKTKAPTGLMKFAKRLMILDRKVKVKDINLRNLQRKIVVQSIGMGILFTAVAEAVFLALPIWR